MKKFKIYLDQDGQGRWSYSGDIVMADSKREAEDSWAQNHNEVPGSWIRAEAWASPENPRL